MSKLLECFRYLIIGWFTFRTACLPIMDRFGHATWKALRSGLAIEWIDRPTISSRREASLVLDHLVRTRSTAKIEFTAFCFPCLLIVCLLLDNRRNISISWRRKNVFS